MKDIKTMKYGHKDGILWHYNAINPFELNLST